ncbi:v-type ATPase 116kda subunit family protein, putative [Ichthyophthirius multifiliis]|uniref:V-type ATPase 116kda subunit family protein, putative n=1 Tax=Ichthyophthirius multifiliis TaxID=5932 RepID=G0R4H2_ICHMU|nr:v-type ATPase 116kda subunit family protein, putative [Ichthyophthirius multifiliis]EGR27623.1 v-type ATPase 116kda subunit family protein, putative [Ichthyophthirius multifiliis]|eukprot:XP_004025075.1 v-type ATPase 116kda subunit family protein, putative [Ichthyophthirius multifiliis]
MSIFRSETMGLYHLILPSESSWEILNELGKLSLLHFLDLNQNTPQLNRTFTPFVKRCEQMLMKISQIKQQLKDFNLQIIKKTTKFDNQKLFNIFQQVIENKNKAGHTYLEEIETQLHNKYEQIQEQIQNYENLKERYIHIIEYKAVLEKTKIILGNQYLDQNNKNKSYENYLDMENINIQNFQQIKNNQVEFKLNYIIGTIDIQDTLKFKKLIFRLTKGNNWTDFINFDQQKITFKGKCTQKSVFVSLIPGSSQGFINSKVQRLCDSIGIQRYNYPQNHQDYDSKCKELDQQIKDVKSLLKLTQLQINKLLQVFVETNSNCEYSYIEILTQYVLKEKQIYQTLNLLKVQNTYYHGNCWLPKKQEELIIQALQTIGAKNQNLPNGQLQEIHQNNLIPPTYFQINEFTHIFQLIVNTYGIPRYQEINPGVFTIVTFPFLFGVMFGDLAHGLFLFFFGAYLCYYSDYFKKAINSIFKDLTQIRYLIILMGFFATFCGLIYNDFMSIPLDIFGSCYNVLEDGKTEKIKDCTYTFGIDPVWGHSENDLQFQNSFKMKMAVIIGVLQMSLGVCMKALNALYFKHNLDFYFEFIPQILFLLVTFGYMDFLIYVKWGQDWSQVLENKKSPPSIINLMIDMPLNNAYPGEITVFGRGNEQQQVGILLLLIAVLCVPVMLCLKPGIIYFKQKKYNKLHQVNQVSDDLLLNNNNDKQNLIQKNHILEYDHMDIKESNFNQMEDDLGKDLEQFKKKNDFINNILLENHIPLNDNHSEQDEQFGDLVVHQIIETIEFVLGSISNTASYLRLWALSLAHGQLSKVFFDKTIKQPIQESDIFGIFIGFFILAEITFMVLICMDAMECFLHALRLHWVEFQNKFYKADGYAFEPFSFKNAIIFENQAQQLVQYSINFLKHGNPSQKVLERVKTFHADSVFTGISALALRANAPEILKNEALENQIGNSNQPKMNYSRCFGSDQQVPVEKAVCANSSASRECDFNVTVFGYNETVQENRAGEFGHNDYYTAVIAAAHQKPEINGNLVLRAMVLQDEIRGRLCECFPLNKYKIDHVVYGAISTICTYGALIAIRTGKQLSDSKGASAALSAEVALMCIKRAMKGFIGPMDIFRNPEAIFRLFRPTQSDNESPFDIYLAESGDDFAVMGMHFKLGLYEHQSASALEGIQRLLLENKIQFHKDNFDIIKNINIVAYQPAFGIIGNPEKRYAKTRQSADHSMVYIISTLLRKAIENQDFLQKLQTVSNLDEIWKTLILLPEDYSHKAIIHPKTRILIDKTTFEHGGQEYDDKYPEGIPTSIKITLENGKILDSGLVMFPAGHAKNQQADLQALLENKFMLLGNIALGSKDKSSELIKRLMNLEKLNNQELQTIYCCDIVYSKISIDDENY